VDDGIAHGVFRIDFRDGETVPMLDCIPCQPANFHFLQFHAFFILFGFYIMG